MELSFLNNNLFYNKTSYQGRSSSGPCFCGKTPKKLIDKINSTKDSKKVKLTFDEAVKIYQYLGYDVLFKRGSHAVVPVEENLNLLLVIPHKDKVISPTDVEKLRFVINGDIEGAKQLQFNGFQKI